MWVEPIVDRSGLDVSIAGRLLTKFDVSGYDSFTDEEKAIWDAGLRGARNYTDLQRVTGNIHHVAGILRECGYSVTPTCKTNWAPGEVPPRSEIERIQFDLNALKKAFSVMQTTPVTPDLPYTHYQKMNDIEKILLDIETLINSMIQIFIPSGAMHAFSGTGYYFVSV